MLIGAPHRQFFGEDQFYEGHLRSDEGWRLWGVTFVGLPFPHLGFNEQLSWTHTGNTPDIADLYLETFDRPAQPAEYRYGDQYQTCAPGRTRSAFAPTLAWPPDGSSSARPTTAHSS